MKRVQFTPDLLPADVVGGGVYHPESQRFEVHKGPIFTHILLADELNRAPAKTQAALLEAMQEAQVTLEGEAHPLPQPFFTIATQNPQEQVGVYELPEAQLDRFALKLTLGYPSEGEELKMLECHHSARPALKPQLNPETLTQLQELAERVFVHPEVSAYLVRITRATRNDPRVALGASPRASLALLKLCKARALLHGRDFVSPDDVRALAPHALAHRLYVHDEHELSGLTSQRILRELCERLPYHGPETPTMG
jgi:MoxR-like ATPase